MRCTHRLLLVLAALAAPLAGDVTNCVCDPKRPETLAPRECGLTKEAMKHGGEGQAFLLKDNNPRKPNRWLALPTYLGPGCNFVHELPAPIRVAVFAAAVGKAKEMFGDDWGIAYNGTKMRTQCHFHVHLGKFLPASETRNFRLIKSLKEIPALKEGGLWVHPVKGGMHVHEGEQIAETVLLR